MTKYLYRNFLACVLLLLTTMLLPVAGRAEGVTPFVHPGLLNNLDELEFIKDKVNRNQEPWKSGYMKLLTQEVDRIEQNSLDMKKLASLNYRPDPRGCENIKTDEDAYKGITCVNTMKNDGMAAYAHALQWYIKGESAHAQKAIEILNAWSYSLKSWTGRRRRYAGYLITPMVNAAEIVRYTSQGWNAKDVNQFKVMLSNIVWQFIKDGHPASMNAHNSNQESSVVMGKMAMAIFLDDRAKFDDAIAHYRRHLKNNIYPDGKNFETCRDLGHTELSLAHLVMASEMAWKQGVDLYGDAGRGKEPNALLRSIEYQLPYILGDRSTPRPDPICKNDPSTTAKDYIDVRRVSPYHELAYHHYHDRKKLPATLLLRVISGKVKGLGSYRPEWGSAVGYGFGTLTHANLPPYPAGHRPR